MCNGHKIKQDTSGNYSGLLIWEPVPPCGEETGGEAAAFETAWHPARENQTKRGFFVKRRPQPHQGKWKAVAVKVSKMLCKSGNIPQQIKAFLSDGPPC